MIRALNIALNAAHPELPLPEAVVFESSPTALFIRGVPRRVGKWALTAVRVAMTRPDGSVATRAAVESAGGVWTVTLPGSPAAGRTAAGMRIYADGEDETGAAVTGYVLGFADLEIKPLSAAPTPAPGTDAHEMWYYDEEPDVPRKGDVCEIAGALKYYDGEAWQSFGSGGGTTDYNDLENKPAVNGVTLSGNKTAADLGLATAAQGAKADTALQADSPALLYEMRAVVDASEIPPSIDPETGLEYIAVSLSDRTINRIEFGNGDTGDLRLALPLVQNGRSRDFYVSLRGTISVAYAPPVVTMTGATLHDVAGGDYSIEIPAQSGYYERTYHFTEIDAATTAPSSDPVFLVANDIPRALYDNHPQMAGAASAGNSENASRGDHVHPAETSGSARYAEVGETEVFIPDDFFPVHATIPGLSVTEFTAENTVFIVEQVGTRKRFVLAYELDGDYLSIARFDYYTGAYVSPGTDVSGVPTFNGIVPTVGGFPMVLQSARSAEPVAVRGVKVAPLASPAFTGTPTAPTPLANDNSMKVATTEFVHALADDKLNARAVINTVYPVGAIYVSVSQTSPATLFGVGTWERITGRFLLAATDEGESGAEQAAGNTGGEATHTLTSNEMPSHTHGSKSLTGSWSTEGWNGVGGSGIVSRASSNYNRKSSGSGNLLGNTKFNIDASHEHDSAGGGQPHNNMPPYLSVYMWKRTA